jgi:hypothetical protein
MMIASSSRRAILALALLVPIPARADPPAAPPTEEEVELAKGLYKEARELERQGRTKEALDKALEAFRTAATPCTGLEAGQLLIEQGQLVEARDMLRAVPMMPVSPRETERGRECRQQASVVAATIDSRIPKLAVSGRPKGVELLLDGRALPAAESAAWQGVNPRMPHTLLVRTEDRTCSTITVTLTEGEVRTIDLHDVAFSCRLVEPPPAETPRSVPVVRPPATTGGESPPTQTPGSEHTAPSPLKWVGLTLGGVGVVALGVGGVLALTAKSDYESVAAQCPGNVCQPHAYNVRVDARTRADWATGTMVLGGIAAASGLLLWLLAPDGSSSQSSDFTRVQLALGLGTVGLTVRLR